MKKRAIVYCENLFGKWDGKTANGLIQESGHYEIVSVIDSSKSGIDSGGLFTWKTERYTHIQGSRSCIIAF
ncbi:hypothetical protein JCM21714_3061 [Gracilibacillus boraciitolerans JCM 21714]|uniref:Uncharacterized protein n=1 Tax=Gracilibacillus boraciitolerans JCM 21714 TaxID=1298598 RepID=W4VMI8_9BACI|nr:hypothetical protein [Gracilibacillus boraciitolerans]GAE93939.1 hypothetical protein JCM21714_3061 [Gracilibacillus boraciitolerans JCM 21714]